MKTSEKYSPEVMERAVRLVFEAKEQHPSEWAAIVSISANLGVFGRNAASLGAPASARHGSA